MENSKIAMHTRYVFLRMALAIQYMWVLASAMPLPQFPRLCNEEPDRDFPLKLFNSD